MKELMPTRKFDRVIFCFATNQSTYDYALNKYGIKMITTGQMIKSIASAVKTCGNFTYYPERYNYHVIRSLMQYLYKCSLYKDESDFRRHSLDRLV